MNRGSRFLALLSLLLSLASLPAAAQSSAVLESIDTLPLAGDVTQVTLRLSAPIGEPVAFTIDNPARLSLDLPGTQLGLPTRSRKVNLGSVRAYSTAQAGSRTRVVLELSELSPYDLSTNGNNVVLLIRSREGASQKAATPSRQTIAAAAPAAASPMPVSTAAPQSGITNLDFRRGDKGQGRLVVTLADAKTPVDVREEGGKIVARFNGATLPQSLQRRLDVLDFATPVQYVDASNTATGAQLAVTTISGADFEQVSYQSGNTFTLELAPLSAAKQEELKRQSPQYKGERISLSFQSVDIRSLLQIIADVAGTNMVVSDSVKGDIAMRLQNVPWDQALDIILRTKGLGMRQEGNVMLVAPLSEIAQREKVELEAQKQHTELAPLRSELIQVNYAKANDLKALLEGGGKDGGNILSTRGKVTVDLRTNTLLVLDTRDKLAEVRELVQRLDIPVKQVLIESRIVIANNDFSRQLGASVGFSHINSLGGASVGISGTGTGATGVAAGGSISTGTTNYTAPGGGTVSFDDSLNFNLPVAGGGSFGLAILGSDYLVDLELSALQAEGRGEVLSSPRVIAANASQASIESGVEIPYQSSAGGSSGATTVSFKKAVLSLSVTPQITPDNRVIMDLQVNKDSVGQQVSDTNGGSIPSIDTRKMSTQVLVDNGNTVVLGGIFEQENTNTVTKVPLLGDVPVLGALFRNKSVVSNKDELLIFVTPKILTESLTSSSG
jgi:type IV pilus assembly protein PilQ